MIDRVRDAVSLRGLHLLARAALRVQRPLAAKKTVDRVARHIREWPTAADLDRGAELLGRAGSCLTRAVTLAALAPRAEVVIGLHPTANAQPFAHAWVELDGATIDVARLAPAELREIARLPPRRAPSIPYVVNMLRLSSACGRRQ